jgi:hypothetical protein
MGGVANWHQPSPQHPYTPATTNVRAPEMEIDVSIQFTSDVHPTRRSPSATRANLTVLFGSALP